MGVFRIIGSARQSFRVAARARVARFVTAGAVALVLSGCSALGLGYGQAPRLGVWWVDRYLDLDDAQGAQLRTALERWQAWHRNGPLAADLALLEQAAQEARQDATAEQTCQWLQRLEQRRDSYLATLAPALADLLPTLTAAQLRHLEARFAKNDADWRDEQLPRDPQKREQAAIDRVLDRTESLYGRLDRAQRDFIAERTRRSPWDPERWLVDRQARQRDTLETFAGWAASPGSLAQRQEQVQRWLVRALQPSSAALRQQREEVIAYQCRFAAELHNRTTERQREHAASKLLGYAASLRSHLPLAAAGSLAPPALSVPAPASR